MERRKQPYSLQKRPTKRKNRFMYYVKFRNPETGDYMNAVSSGCLNRDDAVRWAEKRLKSGLVGRESIRFREYVEGFWDRGSRYAQGRIARGKSISNGTLEIAEGNTRNHLLPIWGNQRLQAMTAGKIDLWIINLPRDSGLASTTINKLLQTLRTILAQATADDLLAHNPARDVKPLSEQPEERGAFTLDELQRLFADKENWPNQVHMTINLLTAGTGMRMGEIRGLGIAAVEDNQIAICRSWEQGHGFKEPKCHSSRVLPLCESISDMLTRVVVSTNPDDILFYGRHSKALPLSKSVIEKYLHEAMTNIGISTNEKKARGLCFHSYRHSMITILRSSGVLDSKVRYIAGHKGSGIQEQYTHFGPVDLDELVEFQRKIIIYSAQKNVIHRVS